MKKTSEQLATIAVLLLLASPLLLRGQVPTGSVPLTRGIDWVTSQHVKPAVANMSIYIRSGSNSLDKAVRKSIAAGVTYVVCAGNGDTFNIGEDAFYP